MAIVAHKIKFKNVNKEQDTFFKKACGVARYTWNWALDRWNENKKNGIKNNAMELKKEYNKIKPDFVYESPKDANQQPFTNLGTAWKRCYDGISGEPQFKSKHDGKDSFYVSNTVFQLDEKKIWLPKIGWVNLSEKLRFKGKILSATISGKAGEWFVSINVDVGDGYVRERSHHQQVGIDLGMSTAATFSNTEKYFAPKPFRKNKKKLARLQRGLARKKRINEEKIKEKKETKEKPEKSKNYCKQQKKYQKQHVRLTNIRKDFWHKLTHKICSENQTVCIENHLNVKGWMKNHSWAFTLADIGLGEFYRQLSYKSQLFRTTVIEIDRCFPSSQICSCCGHRQSMPLEIRVFKCKNCGLEIDRDINAAINILTEGLTGRWTQLSIEAKTFGDMKPLAQSELSFVNEPETSI